MKRLTTYINEQKYRIQEILEDISGRAGSEKLHRLRVEIKKLRAVIDVLEKKYPSDKIKKSSAPLRRLFKQAGRIREKEVQASLFTSFGLQVPEDWTRSDPELDVKMYTPDLEKMYKKLLKFADRIGKITVLDHITSKDNEWRKLMIDNGINCNFHEARKLVKIVIYLQPCVDKKHRVDPTRYKILQDLMGEWNDRDELIQLCEANNYYLEHLSNLKKSRDDLAGRIVLHFKGFS